MKQIVFLFILYKFSASSRPTLPRISQNLIQNRFSNTQALNALPLIKSRFDSLVAIQTTDNTHLCSGVLIDIDFVLTSASCLMIANDGFYKENEVSFLFPENLDFAFLIRSSKFTVTAQLYWIPHRKTLKRFSAIKSLIALSSQMIWPFYTLTRLTMKISVTS